MTRRRLVLALVGIAGALLLAAVAAIWSIESLRWRAQVAWLVASGQVTDLGLGETIPMLKPGSRYWLEGLVDTHNPYSSIGNPYTGDDDARAGAKVFGQSCASCHGSDARGGPSAPSLVGRGFKNGDSDWAVYRTIQRGVAATSMPPHDWPDTRIWSVVSYLRSVNNVEAAQADGTEASPVVANVRVPFSELATQRLPADDWLTYSGSYSGARHSTLKEINTTNVARLAPRWIHQFDVGSVRIEMSPLVRGDAMFVTYAGNAAALDARTGTRLWEFVRPQPADLKACCSVVNRGLAILDDKLFLATIDAHLIALASSTGKQLWDVRVVADYRVGYAITAAPLLMKCKESNIKKILFVKIQTNLYIIFKCY